MWKKFALGAGAIVALAIVLVAAQPESFAVERSVSIDAPARLVFPHIVSVQAMDVWSPWTKLDPAMQVRYDGPASGVGARSSWEGPEMGAGSVTVTGATPDREVEMELEMFTPMEATNRVVFSLDPTGDATRVTWRLEGTNGFVGKATALVMDMDQMVGGEFEKGLAALKVLAETEASAQAAR